MPFTAAHSAIILPLLKLKRFRFSTTGLVIGSMAPDFEYFFRLKTYSLISHRLSGIFLFNIPVTFLLALLFHLLVRDMVVEYLPPYFKSRALHVKKVKWLLYLQNHWFAFLVSAVLGAASHIFWDDFTYDGGYSVNAFPILGEYVWVLGTPVMICRFVQHLSTGIGLIVLFWYIHQSSSVPLPAKETNNTKWLYFWTKVLLVGIVFLGINFIARPLTDLNLSNTIAVLISGWLLVLLFAGFYKKLRTKTA